METATILEKKLAVRRAIDELVDFMTQANKVHTEARFPNLKPDTYWVDGGQKYVRIAYGAVHGEGGAVHCFVDAETGDVYKAAGWKKPALNGARFNILDPESLADLKSKWDPYTSYLYKR